MMIRDIGTKLKAKLVEKRCPIQDVLFEERTSTTTGARERIVLERNRNVPDTFSSVQGTHPNPKHVGKRGVAFVLTIYCQSAKSGALSFEHEDRADRLVEAVIASLDRVLRGDLQVSWSVTSGGFITPPEFAESSRQPGLVYELRFTADRAVKDVTWAGDAKPEVEIGDGFIKSRTEVGLANAPEGAPVVTGCGGN